jgi:hypothetical protein
MASMTSGDVHLPGDYFPISIRPLPEEVGLICYAAVIAIWNDQKAV